MDDLEKRSRCRVCGWRFNSPVWDEDPEEGATYDICPSCGCEAGHQDFTLESTRNYRDEWRAAGMPWSYPVLNLTPPPPNWNPIEQMQHVPPEWI